MRLVFWQAFHSPHQYALLDALSRHPQVESVELVLDQDMSDERRNMHWAEPQYELVDVHSRPGPAMVDLLVRRADTVHIFSGFHQDPTARQGMNACVRLGRKFVVMAEAGDWYGHGLRRYPRLALHVLRRLQYGSSVRHILAIGQLGVAWYRRVGYRPEKLTAFAYFVAPPRLATGAAPSAPQLLFVGRALPYKGGELLLRSLAHLVHRSWQATMVTQGPEREAWEALSRALGLHDRVTFVDFEPPDRVLQRMADASFLVLPNTADEGWGAVVSEALFQGTPVVCTTRTGAGDMIAGVPERGQVAEPTERALTLALARQLDRGHPSTEQRQVVVEGLQADWSGAGGARRLIQALTPRSVQGRTP